MRRTARLLSGVPPFRPEAWDGVVPIPAQLRPQPYRAWPTHPIWLGFAINTIFYGALLWLLFLGLGFTRRAIRRRRGSCAVCTYPRGESDVCTECGERFRSGR